jgi:hypothetical protein
VQPFFVSEEKQARQAYRYDSRYRLAAFLLIVAIPFQVPFFVLLYYENRIREEEQNRGASTLQTMAQLTAEFAGLRETEVQLGQIKSWEPILRGRMPTSAVLGAVEQTIPREVVLSRIALEAANFRPISLGTSSFRIPETYTITLQGEQKGTDAGLWKKFVSDFLSRLPPGSSAVSSTVSDVGIAKCGILTCKAVLRAQANGNYFPLGVNKIDAEENL